MPHHKQVTACLRGGGPLSKHCSCEHCNLSVCSVCGAWEGGLTTDCPGQSVGYDRHQEVWETQLDYTDQRGWHQADPSQRVPRFEKSPLPPAESHEDPRMTVAPGVDWEMIDRNAELQHKLYLKAIAWVLADRVCEDKSAALARVEEETAMLRGKSDLAETEAALLAKLEREQIDFRIADRHAQKCDDEFRQTARLLVEALEQRLKIVP